MKLVFVCFYHYHVPPNDICFEPVRSDSSASLSDSPDTLFNATVAQSITFFFSINSKYLYLNKQNQNFLLIVLLPFPQNFQLLKFMPSRRSVPRKCDRRDRTGKATGSNNPGKGWSTIPRSTTLNWWLLLGYSEVISFGLF